MTITTMPSRQQSTLPPLEQGDGLDQPTFHARYEAMPLRTRAELIGGIVYMPSPLKVPHGYVHAGVVGWLFTYASSSPALNVLDNATHILGNDSEVQPDASLLISGGQTRVNADGYVEGAPELIVEVASSSEAYDLNVKRRDYERYGVSEYLVVLLREQRVVWYARGGQNLFTEIVADGGLIKSRRLPGLWLEANAIFRDDMPRLLETLRQGMASPEHAAFVQTLAGARGNPI
jgi:Uma2 family endonuclease